MTSTDSIFSQEWLSALLNFSWTHLATFVVGGGAGALLTKLAGPLFNEYRRRTEARETARQVRDRHLDPILKAADDLVGKLQSLAGHDFRELLDLPVSTAGIAATVELTNALYLFGQFWSRAQILRQEALYTNLSADPLGERLRIFLETLERRGVGVVDRPYQRGMGESLVRRRGQALACASYYEFVGLYLSSQRLQEWFEPLRKILQGVKDQRLRQRVLLYGAVLHAMIDTLDPQHLATSDRRGWANKLNRKSRADLRFRIFNKYLTFVTEVEKYAGRK